MRTRLRGVGGAMCCSLLVFTSAVFAQTGGIVSGPIANPDQNNMGFAGTALDLVATGTYTFDDARQEGMNNDVVGFKPLGVATLPGDSALMTTHISVGENGHDGFDSANPDVPNMQAADPVFASMGQTGLENGNYIRFSSWIRLDENDLPAVAPQIEPLFKLEFWTEALSQNGDFNLQLNPVFGDRIYDTDQNGLVAYADQVDINNDGSVSLGTPSVTASTSWQMVVTDYVVDDSLWQYSDPDSGNGPSIVTAADVEEIRATMFVGDWTNADLTNGGTFMLDHPMVEVYKNQAAAPTTVPNPTPGSITSLVDGDFNDDGAFDCLDVDSLVAVIAAQTHDTQFDLTNDGSVTRADLNQWLVDAGSENLPSGNPYFGADANLDGVVDVTDFARWNGSQGTATAAFCSGDFNADGFTDVSDFAIWNSQKFQNANLAVVPEPSAAVLALLGLLTMCGFRRRS